MDGVSPLSRPPTLVGRDRELAILRARLAAALSGRGSVVLISGEAGVGKTALADALCREAEDAGIDILAGHSYDRTETPPYGPWIECLAQLEEIERGAFRPVSASPSPATAPSQDAFFVQARAFFAALATVRPLVLLLDDLHWADAASLDLLRFLARSLASVPLLLIVTYREEELNPRHPLSGIIPLLVREASVDRIDLRARRHRGPRARRYTLRSPGGRGGAPRHLPD
jgi:predicted ATPase